MSQGQLLFGGLELVLQHGVVVHATAQCRVLILELPEPIVALI